MKLTQEQLDKEAQALRNVWGNPGAWNDLPRTIKENYRSCVQAVHQAHDGEPCEIVEPEPEIPDEVIAAASSALHERIPLQSTASGANCNCRNSTKTVLLAAYKAGWGGMRK